MRPRPSSGISLVQILIVIGLIAILACLALPSVGLGSLKVRHTIILSNMRKLHLATQQMALDREAEKNVNIGWPGDTGGSFSNWTAHLVKGNYLSREKLGEFLSARGFRVSKNDPLTNNRTAVLVYTVSEANDGAVVFLSSANFTNSPTGGVLDPTKKPLGASGFVVLRKAGDGAILQPRQVGLTNIIGTYVPLSR